jgi:palmitoyltransferase ZDHHC9/14/18
VGIGIWLLMATAVGYAVPLPGIDASPALLAAVGGLLLLAETALVLTHFVDPGIIVPSGVDDPIVARLEAGGDDVDRGGGDEGAGGTEGVRWDHRSGQWARMSDNDGGDGGGGTAEEDVESGGLIDGSGTAGGVAWDWAKCERYCRTCKIWRPPRAAHCSECGYCIRRFDHHCGAVGNCVGQENHRWFIVFLCAVSALVVTLFVVGVAHLRRLGWPAPAAWTAGWRVYVLLAAVFVYGYMSCLSCFAASHCWIFFCDVTTKELMRPRVRRAALEGGCGGSTGGDDGAGTAGETGASGGSRGRPGDAGAGTDADDKGRAGAGASSRPRAAARAEVWRTVCGCERLVDPPACLWRHMVQTVFCAKCQLKSVTERRIRTRLLEEQ